MKAAAHQKNKEPRQGKELYVSIGEPDQENNL